MKNGNDLTSVGVHPVVIKMLEKLQAYYHYKNGRRRGSGGGSVNLWRKLYFLFLFIGSAFGVGISVLFKNVDLLPGLSLISCGIILGMPFGMALDKEILRREGE